MNPYLILIITILIASYVLDTIVQFLNVQNLKSKLPKQFANLYDQKKYQKSQNYLKTSTKFGLVKDTFYLILTLVFITSAGFNYLDLFARSFGHSEIATGLIFALIFSLVTTIVGLPFSAYSTFVIEQRFGFNKTTPKTFILDKLKGLLLGTTIGGAIFALIIWFFLTAGPFAWAYAWITVTTIQLFLMFIAPVIIMPIFNKFTPLPKGKLKTAIQTYANSQKFRLQGIYTIDGSRRSTKANAFFTGFGRFKRIALFDTLTKKHTTSELVAILAHEIGHYKLKHIPKMLLLSTLVTGITFYFFSLFINNPTLFAAFGMQHTSVYASLIFVSLIYSPISQIFSIATNWLSRHHEFQADAFAIKTYPKPKTFATALKKLAADNLTNLTPHPLKVILDYSHPPILKRLEAITSSKN